MKNPASKLRDILKLLDNNYHNCLSKKKKGKKMKRKIKKGKKNIICIKHEN